VVAVAGSLRHDIEVEDTLVMAIEFLSGVIAVLEGEHGLLVRLFHVSRSTYHCGDVGARGERAGPPRYPGGLGPLPGVGRKTAFERSPSPTELKLEPHRRQIEDFVWAVREDRDLAVTGEDARETLRLALAAYASAREGRAILMEGR